MINPVDLSGRNILVTGASSGIGRGIAVYLSKLGANIVMVARNEERLMEVLSELEPGSHSYHLCDFNDPGTISNTVDSVCRDGFRLNGLVHSAGISRTVPLQYLKLSDLNGIMSVNLYSFIELAKQFSKRKNNDSGGSIVAISSISSRVGARGLTAYCASKGALDSAIRAMALDLAPKNIRINSVAPGMIRTQMYDGLKSTVNDQDFEEGLKKRQIMGIGEPEDIAAATAFLLSDAAGFITGTSLTVDGGYLSH
jgi:NAD(P)-dependent dehydrogenase (short-subunit alcohol dehydrogenase family)